MPEQPTRADVSTIAISPRTTFIKLGASVPQGSGERKENSGVARECKTGLGPAGKGAGKGDRTPKTKGPVPFSGRPQTPPIAESGRPTYIDPDPFTITNP